MSTTESETTDMSKLAIPLVKPEQAIRQMLPFNLTRAGYRVLDEPTSTAAHAHLARRKPSLLLVNWILPDFRGLELTRSVKSNADLSDIPIITPTAKAQEQNKITELDGAVDEYVTKPFSLHELVSRINALL